MLYDPDRIYDLPMKEIYADLTFNCRGHIDPASCAELAKDIKNKGLVQPVMVQPYDKVPGKKFRIVMGHRRHMAHQINHAETIRAIVKEGLSDLDARVLNICENIQRQDLNILQEAMSIDSLRRGGWNELQTADKIGMSRGWVQVRFMLLDLPIEIQHEAAAGLIPQSAIRKAWALGSREEQFEYIKKVKDAKFKGLIKDPKATVKKQNVRKPRSPQEIEELQDVIRGLNSSQNNDMTRVLGWAAGFLSDNEIHMHLVRWAATMGKLYSIPPEFVGTRAKDVPADAPAAA